MQCWDDTKEVMQRCDAALQPSNVNKQENEYNIAMLRSNSLASIKEWKMQRCGSAFQFSDEIQTHKFGKLRISISKR